MISETKDLFNFRIKLCRRQFRLTVNFDKMKAFGIQHFGKKILLLFTAFDDSVILNNTFINLALTNTTMPELEHFNNRITYIHCKTLISLKASVCGLLANRTVDVKLHYF